MKEEKKTSKPAGKDDSIVFDARTAELVAIGASVAGHCQPCLAHHIAKARELGIDDEHIRAAIDVGHTVEKGAMLSMREFAESATGASPKQTSACCGGAPSKGGGKCCG